jgi:hypothetical protein
MVVFLRTIVVGLVLGFVDSGVMLVVVVRGVLHVGNITALATISDSGMVIFPNPSREGAVWLRGSWNAPVTVTMVDVLGREMARITWTDTLTQEQQRFVYGKVTRGMYSLIIEERGSRRVVRLQVSD